jgi:hypothetical protein
MDVLLLFFKLGWTYTLPQTRNALMTKFASLAPALEQPALPVLPGRLRALVRQSGAIVYPHLATRL